MTESASKGWAYEVVVAGRLGDAFRAAFPDLCVGSTSPSTRFVIEMERGAESSLAATLREHGLELLSVRRLSHRVDLG